MSQATNSINYQIQWQQTPSAKFAYKHACSLTTRFTVSMCTTLVYFNSKNISQKWGGQITLLPPWPKFWGTRPPCPPVIYATDAEYTLCVGVDALACMQFVVPRCNRNYDKLTVDIHDLRRLRAAIDQSKRPLKSTWEWDHTLNRNRQWRTCRHWWTMTPSLYWTRWRNKRCAFKAGLQLV